MKKDKPGIVPAVLFQEERTGVFTMGADCLCILSPEVAELPMIPAPETMGLSQGDQISHKESLVCLKDLSDGWLENLKRRAGHSPAGGSREIRLDLDRALSGPEAYKLEISKEEIEITASGGPGFLYAFQSLEQMMEKGGEIPAGVVRDEPSFPWRGLHLDSGRFYQNLEDIKSFIDIMVLHKFNIFHWHLTEDQGWRIEIKKYPRLTEVGSRREETIWGHYVESEKEGDRTVHEGFYSQKEIRDLVAYARVRGIMVVPEIDLPGHSRAAIAAYPELGVKGE